MKSMGIHHVGIWVADATEMITFLTEIMGFRLLSRNPRGPVGTGERIFIQTDKDQLIEVLTEPAAQPRPDFPIHPIGHVVGVPHLCFRVDDLAAWHDRLISFDYAVSQQMPESGYMDSELGALRLAWFEGPGGVGIELFEFEQPEI